MTYQLPRNRLNAETLQCNLDICDCATFHLAEVGWPRISRNRLPDTLARTARHPGTRVEIPAQIHESTLDLGPRARERSRQVGPKANVQYQPSGVALSRARPPRFDSGLPVLPRGAPEKFMLWGTLGAPPLVYCR